MSVELINQLFYPIVAVATLAALVIVWCVAKRFGWILEIQSFFAPAYQLFFTSYKWLTESKWLFLGYTAFIAIPPALAGLTQYSPKDPTKALTSLQLFFNNNQGIYFLCFLWPAIADPPLKMLKSFLDEKLKEFSGLPDTGLVQLLELFDTSVGNKIDHLERRIKTAVTDGKLTADRTKMLTESSPQLEQLRSLVDGIHTVFTDMTQVKGLKVTLSTVVDDTLGEFVYFLPKGERPVTSPEKLRNRQSGFSWACRTRQIHIVPDASRHFNKKGDSRKFVAEKQSEGSLIVYPINHRGLSETILLVSIFSSKSNTFMSQEKEKYEFILKKFEKRMIVEYSLLILGRSGL